MNCIYMYNVASPWDGDLPISTLITFYRKTENTVDVPGLWFQQQGQGTAEMIWALSYQDLSE